MSSLHRLIHHSSGLTRRQLLGSLARTAFGLTVLSALEPLSGLGLQAAEPGRPRRQARACIYLYMNGGMSHLDTFDPKQGHADAGPLKAIASNVDGVQLL